MIDVAAATEAFENKEIDYVGWVPSNWKISNGLTKIKPCPTLEEFLKTSTLNLDIRTVENRRYESLPLGFEDRATSSKSDSQSPETKKWECDKN